MGASIRAHDFEPKLEIGLNRNMNLIATILIQISIESDVELGIELHWKLTRTLH